MDILKAQQHFENVSGLNLSEFFEQWIYGIGYPKLDVELFVDTIEGKDYSKKIVINQVQLENWGIFRDVPVNITFKLSDGKLIDSVLILNEKNQSYLIDNIEIDTIYINNGSIVRSLLQVTSVKTLKENSIFEDNNNLAEYLIYDNEIVIRIEEFLNDGKVILYDYLGRIIYSNQLTNMEIFSIPISNLEQGLYILIITEQGQVIKKQAISIVK
jgi:hypothetical protein